MDNKNALMELDYYEDIFNEFNIEDNILNILEIYSVAAYDLLEVCLTKKNIYLTMPSSGLILYQTSNIDPSMSFVDYGRGTHFNTTFSILSHILDDVNSAYQDRLYCLLTDAASLLDYICDYIDNLKVLYSLYTSKDLQNYSTRSSISLNISVVVKRLISELYSCVMRKIFKPEFSIYANEYRYLKRKKTTKKKNYVYLIRAADSNLVKIGYSNNPQKRLEDLQTASPLKLELLGIIEGDAKLEHSLHIKYATHHVHGEWFTISNELLAEFRDMK